MSVIRTPNLSFTTTASPSSFSGGSIAAGLLLAALAAVALVLARRRRNLPRLVEIVETASLGPRRSLVVARIGDELLLLGSSEGGIALLTTRPASLAAQAEAAPRAPRAIDGAMSGLRDALLARAAPAAPPQPAAAPLRERLLARLRPRAAAPATAAVETLLAESVEDVELRRKLAAGQIGSVR